MLYPSIRLRWLPNRPIRRLEVHPDGRPGYLFHRAREVRVVQGPTNVENGPAKVEGSGRRGPHGLH